MLSHYHMKESSELCFFLKIWLADSIYFGKSCSVTYYKQTRAIFKLHFVVQIFNIYIYI